MPTSFSRVDLPSPESLDLVMEAIKLHSGDLIRKQLELDGLAGEHEEAVCQRILETWLQSARQKLKSNLTIEGVNWREWEAQSQTLAPLDTQLSNRLNNLSRTADELTEEVVQQRRELPQRHAEAWKAREEVLAVAQDKLAEERDKVNRTGWHEEASATDLPIARQDEVRETLTTALASANTLTEELPSRVKAVQEQYELVSQLRSMPP